MRSISTFAWAAFLFSLSYNVCQILDIAGLFTPAWGLFAVVLPSLFLAWSWLALISSIHSAAVAASKLWTQLSLSFGIAYATLNSLVYIVQLAVVVPEALRGGLGMSNSFALAEGKAFTAVNAAAYFLLSLSAFFLAFSYPRLKNFRFVRIALVSHGAVGPIVLAILYIPALLPVGAIWMLTFAAVCIGIIRTQKWHVTSVEE